MVYLLLSLTMFFNLAKLLRMNLEVVIIFKEQISKLYILAANLLTHWEQNYGTLFQRKQKYQNLL